MLLAEIVATSRAVGSTSARSAKIAALAELLVRLEPDEVVPAVSLLIGTPWQGRIGVGWATIAAVDAAPAAEPTVSVLDLDRAVSDLAALSGSGSAGARHALLTDLLGRATADEADLVRRVLTGELRQGALAGLMADAVARAAGVPATAMRRAAMLAGDLASVAALALTEGAGALDAIGLQVLRPLQPMLASTATDVIAAVEACGLSSVEWKLDGARIQVHRAGKDVRIYTRNLNDVTERLPGVVAVARVLPVDATVLDGEVLGTGTGTGTADTRPDLFQDTMSQFSRHARPGAGGGTAHAGLQAWFFDCLHVDGDDLIDRPLLERLEVLERIAGAARIPGVVTAEPEVAAAVLDEALAAGHEGVMVKSASSTYEAGRRGKAWRKVKPVRTLDLVVLGAEWGHGRRRGRLSNLHLGARDPGGGFVMVGKTFKGLTDELLAWQTDALQAIATHEEGITVYVRPELVVEVALDGVQKSTRYAGGVALRFARVRSYRADKSAAEADTIDEVRGMLPGTGAAG